MTDEPGADPGGHFASDAHRRVMCAMANPDSSNPGTVIELYRRVDADDQLVISAERLVEICIELEADGEAARDDMDRWRNTESGFEKLTGPPKGAKK